MRTSRLLLCSLLLLATSCGKETPTLSMVEGKVLYRGEPVAGGTIVFSPDPERGGQGPLAWAQIDAEGRYRLKTEGRLGATPGWHRITIASSGKLPARYLDPELSEQRFEVRTDRANMCDLFLE